MRCALRLGWFYCSDMLLGLFVDLFSNSLHLNFEGQLRFSSKVGNSKSMYRMVLGTTLPLSFSTYTTTHLHPRPPLHQKEVRSSKFYPLQFQDVIIHHTLIAATTSLKKWRILILMLLHDNAEHRRQIVAVTCRCRRLQIPPKNRLKQLTITYAQQRRRRSVKGCSQQLSPTNLGKCSNMPLLVTLLSCNRHVFGLPMGPHLLFLIKWWKSLSQCSLSRPNSDHS